MFEISQPAKQKAKELVSKMTLEEKVSLCSGLDDWHTKPLERLKLDSILMCDGPHGLRKQIGKSDGFGLGESVPAVCFPTASALACSFNRELAYEIGEAIGEECAAEGVSIVLGPGANQKRSPLCGRNFEYFSEDPLLSGEMAAAMIRGVQSTGTAASLKHFAVNNQEKRRMTISAVVDERALRETYLRSFEIAVKKGRPATVMCAYNRLNGEYCSENKKLLTDILRDEWGFDGIVLSDWNAVHDRALGILAGLDLQMPGNGGYNDAKILEAVKSNALSEEDLDKVLCRVVSFILTCVQNKKESFEADKTKHHQLAVKAAEQCAVLLKNDGHLLPGSVNQRAAVIGAFAKKPRYQGAGSSKINPFLIDTPWDALVSLGLKAEYAPGYRLQGEDIKGSDESLIRQACETAKEKDIVYIFAGLPEGYESEGFDRKGLELPPEHNRLIEAVSACCANVVVVLIGGAPMALPWIDKVKAVLAAYLGGEGGGQAVANLLLGFQSPCGKLAETWPLRLEDVPCHAYFPGGRQTSEYRESLYVGYRYYEKAQKPVLFPFGHGLSYADFDYTDIRLDRDTCRYGEPVTLTFKLKNRGKTAAYETALVFSAHQSETVFMPVKELREFVRVYLEPGETKEVSITLDTSSFGYYNTSVNGWYAESGVYRILVGPSSASCPLEACIKMTSPAMPQPDLRHAAPSYYTLPKATFTVSDAEFEALYASKLPVHDKKPARPFTVNDTLDDVKHTLVGKIIISAAKRIAKKTTKADKAQEGMILATMLEMAFFAMPVSGQMSESTMLGILDLLNGRYLRGFRKLLSRRTTIA